MSSDLTTKLNDEERQRFETAMAAISKAFPSKTLLQCPLGPDGSIEIRVSRWPTCAEDLDAVMAVVQAVRDTFRAKAAR